MSETMDRLTGVVSSDAPPFYVVGGTVPVGSAAYVTRSADLELLQALLRGEFCYVLTSRQMGKSSLMARTVTRLRETGAHVAVNVPRLARPVDRAEVPRLSGPHR